MSGANNGFTVSSSEFISREVRCDGDLYLPRGGGKAPVVIMGHGFAAERVFRLPAYAEHFAKKGIAVYIFDYRCFGGSAGEPRNYVSPKRHLQDWEAAIAHVRSLAEIDTSRIALWGSSFGGGHVIVTASRHPEISAIVAQVPFVDAVSSARSLGFGFLARAIPLALRDILRAITFRSPCNIKVIGHPDEIAVMNTADSFPGYSSIIPEGSSWENKCPARILFTFSQYRPISYAAGVKCPALVMLAEEDSLVAAAAVEKTAAKMPNAHLVKYSFGHFDIYTGKEFEDAVEKQAEFLVKHLGIGAEPS